MYCLKYQSNINILHSYEDVTITGKWLHSLGLCLTRWSSTRYRDLYRATSASTRKLGFWSLIRWTASCSRLARQARDTEDYSNLDPHGERLVVWSGSHLYSLYISIWLYSVNLIENHVQNSVFKLIWTKSAFRQLRKNKNSGKLDESKFFCYMHDHHVSFRGPFHQKA